jgi:hypothetical protein
LFWQRDSQMLKPSFRGLKIRKAKKKSPETPIFQSVSEDKRL